MINRCLIEQFQKRELYVYFIILFLVAALRANTVGGDLENYIPHFQEVSQTDFQYLFDLRKSNYEVGYTILIKLITLILGSERSFFVVTSFISLLGVFVLIKNYSKIPFLSILLYVAFGFYTNTFNNVRQALAISFICLSFKYLVEKEFWKYLSFVLVASLFHISAIFCLCLYPLISIRLDTKKFLLFTIAGIITFFTLGLWLFNYFRNNIFIQYASDIQSEALRAGEGYSLLTMYFVITLFAFIVENKYSNNFDNRTKVIMNILLIQLMMATFVQFFATQMATFTRMSQYFFLNMIILIPNIISFSIKLGKSRLIAMLIITMLAFVYMGLIVFAYSQSTHSNSQGVLPYVFLNN